MSTKKNTIVLCGFMACGKSTLGKALARQLGYDFVDTDAMLLSDSGMTLAEMFAKGGEAYFRDLEHETIKKAAALRNTIISTGGGVMTFERNARLLAENAEIIHVCRSFDLCYESIRCRQNRPIAGQKTREQMEAMYNARQDAYNRWATLVLPNDGTAEEALRRITAWLNA